MHIRQAIIFVWDYLLNSLTQGSHLSGDRKFQVFSWLFPGKRNKIPGQFGFESVLVLIIKPCLDMIDVNDIFGKD